VETQTVDAEADASEFEALREASVQQDLADRGVTQSSEGTPAPEAPVPPVKDSEEPSKTSEKPDISEHELEKPPKPGVKDEKQQVTDKSPVPEEKETKSRYAQAREDDAKERERQDRSWTRIEAEKKRIRAELDAEREKVRRERLEWEATQRPITDSAGKTQEQYYTTYRLARDEAIKADSQGDYEQSAQHWKNSTLFMENFLNMHDQAMEMQNRQATSAQELAWEKDREKAEADEPELLNPDSDLRKTLGQLYQTEGHYLKKEPNGFHKLVELTRLILMANSYSEMREENEMLRAREEERLRSSQPAKGGPGKPPKAKKSLDDMTTEELLADTWQKTQEADRYMGH
jgi:hypothetical protein